MNINTYYTYSLILIIMQPLHLYIKICIFYGIYPSNSSSDIYQFLKEAHTQQITNIPSSLTSINDDENTHFDHYLQTCHKWITSNIIMNNPHIDDIHDIIQLWKTRIQFILYLHHSHIIQLNTHTYKQCQAILNTPFVAHTYDTFNEFFDEFICIEEDLLYTQFRSNDIHRYECEFLNHNVV